MNSKMQNQNQEFGEIWLDVVLRPEGKDKSGFCCPRRKMPLTRENNILFATARAIFRLKKTSQENHNGEGWVGRCRKLYF